MMQWAFLLVMMWGTGLGAGVGQAEDFLGDSGGAEDSGGGSPLASPARGKTSGGGGGGFELPLTVAETVGSGGTKYISNGVPLRPGQAMTTDQLRVIGPDGQPVPAQFRVLARWWRVDDSIRWVLVDFVGDVPGMNRRVYTLVGASDPQALETAPATPLTLTEDDGFFTVDTGPARFKISRTRFNLIHELRIDADADGVFADGETVVFPDESLGSVVEGPAGRRYYSALGTQSVAVIDRGPVRVTLLAKGVHVSKEEGAFEPGLYGYEVLLTFHTDRPYVDVESVLTNNFEKPIGEPHFEDWSMITRVGPATSGAGGSGGAGGEFWGSGYTTMKMPAGGSCLLYQDSLGVHDWRRLPGVEPRHESLATFRGYQIRAVSPDGGREVLDAGDFAAGYGQCGRSGMGCVIAPKDFWQQFPSAIEYAHDGTLRYAMFPREYKSVHWLEDGSAKGQAFRLHFYIKGAKRKYTVFAGTHRPIPHVVMDNYRSRPWAMPPVAHAGACGALSDVGPYRVDETIPKISFSLPTRDRRSMMTDPMKGNGYGWQAYGTRWEELAGHSPWNYEPIWSSSSLFNYMLTRDPVYKDFGLRVARQARDVRAYLIDDQDNLAVWTKGGLSYQKNSVFEAFARPIPDTGAHPYPRTGWPLPNQAHLNLDEVYDLYLMTGDDRARRCMEMIACHGAITTTQLRRFEVPHRSEGWCMRALMRYYDLTGDERFKPFVDQAMDRAWAQIHKAGTQGPTWFGGVFGRGVITAYLATGDERMRDMALGQSDWARAYECGDGGYRGGDYQRVMYGTDPTDRGPYIPWASAYQTDVHAFGYEQTGRPAYREAAEFAVETLDPTVGHFLMFLASTRQRLQPRSDTAAPAAIADLAAVPAGPGAVTLSWTAPGGDDATGTAAVYQIKHADKPVLEFVSWPDQKDTHVAFWGAENVSDEPAPAAAGTPQTYELKGLAAGTHYVAIKTRDAVNNESPMSNVVSVEIK